MDCYLIIGGAGFIGSNIVRHLLAQDNAPRLIVLEPQGADVSRLNGCDVTLVNGVLSDTHLIESTIRKYECSHVLHLVSTMTPSSDYIAYTNELKDVVKPTIDLLDVCSALGVRLVFFSSGGAIYGESDNGKPIKESDKTKPISYYGLAKQVIEANIRFAHRICGLEYLILRPSNPYGIGQRLDGKQGVIAVALGKILKGEKVTIWGDGSMVRDYIYIDDLSKIACAIIASGVRNKTINIGSGKGLSLKDIVSDIRQVVQKPFEVEHTHKNKSDVSHVVLNVEKMRQLYKKPLVGIKEGIERFYNYCITNGQDVSK